MNNENDYAKISSCKIDCLNYSSCSDCVEQDKYVKGEFNEDRYFKMLEKLDEKELELLKREIKVTVGEALEFFDPDYMKEEVRDRIPEHADLLVGIIDEIMEDKERSD